MKTKLNSVPPLTYYSPQETEMAGPLPCLIEALNRIKTCNAQFEADLAILDIISKKLGYIEVKPEDTPNKILNQEDFNSKLWDEICLFEKNLKQLSSIIANFEIFI